MLCTEGHGKFISAAEIAGQETFLMCGLGFLVFESVCVLSSLRTKRHKLSAGCSKVVSVVLAFLYKALSWQMRRLSVHTSDTQGCFFSKYVSGVRPVLAGCVLNCFPLKPSLSAAFAEIFSGCLHRSGSAVSMYATGNVFVQARHSGMVQLKGQAYSFVPMVI